MTSSPDPIDKYARGMALFEEWVGRRAQGTAESASAFIAANEEYREILEGMVESAPEIDLEATSAPRASDDPTYDAMESREASAEPRTFRPPRVNQEFGAYRLLEVVGQGGMGTVFLAEHSELGRRVALKVIRPERLFSSQTKRRFWREARAVAGLDHPNICPVYEVGEVEGAPFMAMRYLDGTSLADWISRAQSASSGQPQSLVLPVSSAPPERTESANPVETHGTAPDSAPSSRDEIHRIVHMIETTARALHVAHENGIIHRDIKPGNIQVTAAGEPIILDFGLAKAEDDGQEPLTMSGDFAGTPLYMSPEQIAPRGRHLDRTTDVYSLGVTLYECLTLRRPFDGSSLHDLQVAILQSDPVAPSRINRRVPRDLEIVVQKSIEKDRARRYRTALEFAEDLRRVRCFEPIRARRTGVVLRLTRWSQRYPTAMGFLIILAVALGIITAQFFATREAKAEYELLAWTHRLRKADAAEAALYPARPDRLPAFGTWVRDHALPLEQNLPLFRETLRLIRARAGHDEAPESPLVEAELKQRLSVEESFKYEVLQGIEKRAAEIVEAPWGELARVKFHIAWFDSADREIGTQHENRWSETRAAIREHPRYGGLDMPPQVGLVPIGVDRQSGLFEFAHLRSGAIPDRDVSTDELEITGDTGLVFVLIPPGTFWMGAQTEPGRQNFDELARADEGPVHQISLDAFFMSKYELTQGQWERLHGGAKPSGLPAGNVYDGKRVTLAHPVDSVSFLECDRVLGWYGLLVPTEAQWEYACRADTATVWYTGSDYESLRGHVNFADQSAKRVGLGYSEIERWPSLDDGYPGHAPVDFLKPNRFGLHHMHGNVWEYCRDLKGNYPDGVRPGDGLRESRGEQRVVRGGAFDKTYEQARCAYRTGRSDDAASLNYGIRPSRSIE